MKKIMSDDIVIEIPEFITHVVLSKNRRIKYKTDEKGKLVIANPRTAGKERKWKINGQSLYSGMNHYLRSKVIKEIKKYLYEYIRPIPVINEFPICIDLTIYDTEGVFNKKGVLVSSWDLGNKEFIWMKCFEDALCGNVDFHLEGDKYVPQKDKYPAKIKDDSIEFISRRVCSFIKVADSKDRKLVFKINKIQ